MKGQSEIYLDPYNKGNFRAQKNNWAYIHFKVDVSFTSTLGLQSGLHPL